MHYKRPLVIAAVLVIVCAIVMFAQMPRVSPVDPNGSCTTDMQLNQSTVCKAGTWTQIGNIYVTDTGANNALVVTGAPTLVNGLPIYIKLAHTLQAGADTIAWNGASAANLKSHFNVSNNIGTAYAATGTIEVVYDGTEFVDLSQ
jgi:hypothetical protein